jgi:hypothetical protein
MTAMHTVKVPQHQAAGRHGKFAVGVVQIDNLQGASLLSHRWNYYNRTRVQMQEQKRKTAKRNFCGKSVPPFFVILFCRLRLL